MMFNFYISDQKQMTLPLDWLDYTLEIMMFL